MQFRFALPYGRTRSYNFVSHLEPFLGSWWLGADRAGTLIGTDNHSIFSALAERNVTVAYKKTAR